MEGLERFFSGSVPLNLSVPVMHSTQFPSQTTFTPQLAILSQRTHSEEVVSKNGIQKTVHIVVKNSPFHFQLGMANANACKIDFNQIAFDAQLLYDCEGDKEVDFVKVKPMEFKASASENGQLVDVEFRIKVLTSQHEDMLFKVKIIGTNPLTHEVVPGLSVISGAIKVISKPEQIKKKQPNKKRTLTDMLIETVTRIEKKQEEQQNLIEKLIQQQTEQMQVINDKKQKFDNFLTWDDQQVILPQNTSLELIQNSEKKQLPEFEDAFVNLVRAYNSMKADEKPEVIRKLVRNSSTRETERLSELLDLFWTEGLQKELGPSRNSLRNVVDHQSNVGEDGCQCPECPHKQELERIDEFYKEFLTSGSVVMPPDFH